MANRYYTQTDIDKVNGFVLHCVQAFMKTLLCAVLVCCTVAGLQAGPYADADKVAADFQARNTIQPLSQSNDTQAKILAELQKQTKLLEAQKPIVIYDPTVKPVPVTQVPTR